VPILDKEILAAVAAGTGCGLVLLDDNDQVIYWSPQMEEITKLGSEQIIGRPWEGLLLPSGFTPDEDDTSLPEMVNADQALPGMTFHVFPGGKVGILRLISNPVFSDSETFPFFVSETPSGIPNQRALIGLLRRQLAYQERYRVSFSLLFLRIKNYHTFIEVLGPEDWELTNRAVFDQLSAYVRMTDSVGLYDDATFWAILTNSTLEGSQVVADKIKRLISTMQVSGLDVFLAAAVGGVCARKGEGVDDLLARGEAELDRAVQDATGISFSG
jgi:diguanylate cyclase (GGDEF)-like protein